MEKRRQVKYSIAAICAVIFGILLWTTPAQAATLEKVASVYDVYNEDTASFKRDLTGDGVAEKVTVKVKDQYEKLSISVNGKSLATLNAKKGEIIGFDVQYISMSKKKKFIAVTATTDNDLSTISAIYKYNSGKKKLVKVLDFHKGLNAWDREVITKATSSSITVRYNCQFAETGGISWNYVYTYKNGKFVLKSSTATANSSHGKFKAARKLTFYTSTKLCKKAFTAKKGNVLKLQKIKVVNKKVYLKFKKNNKTGWIKVNNSKNNWFYDITLVC